MIANQTHRAAAAYLGAFLLFSTAYAAHADVVTDWNQTAIRATEIAGSPPPLQSRVMAMVHAAIFDAVNGIEHKYSPNAVDVSAASGASADAAAAAAAHGVLERLYPPHRCPLGVCTCWNGERCRFAPCSASRATARFQLDGLLRGRLRRCGLE